MAGEQFQLRAGEVDVLHQARLGDLDFQRARRKAAAQQAVEQVAGKLRLGQLQGRDVDRQAEVARQMSGGEPLLQLEDGVVDHPVADAQDVAAGLGHGDEVGGGDEAELGVNPAQQRFGADDAAAEQFDIRLIDEKELLVVQGDAQGFVQADALLQGVLDARLVLTPARTAVRQGEGGQAQQVLGGLVRHVGMADADPGV
ncbi:hypothetical protein D3C84_537070 [compost metagenome]